MLKHSEEQCTWTNFKLIKNDTFKNKQGDSTRICHFIEDDSRKVSKDDVGTLNVNVKQILHTSNVPLNSSITIENGNSSDSK